MLPLFVAILINVMDISFDLSPLTPVTPETMKLMQAPIIVTPPHEDSTHSKARKPGVCALFVTNSLFCFKCVIIHYTASIIFGNL